MNITKNITAFFEKHYPEYNHEGLNDLSSAFISKTIPKDTIILSESTSDDKLRFLNKGIVREYYLNEAKEMNINFYLQSNFITDFSSFMNTSRTRKNQATLTDIELFELDRKPFLRLLNSYECAQNMMDEIFQRLLKVREQFEYNRMTKTPEELYQELRIYKPEWLQKIPQYHIASYLGITPETLRWRRRERQQEFIQPAPVECHFLALRGFGGFHGAGDVFGWFQLCWSRTTVGIASFQKWNNKTKYTLLHLAPSYNLFQGAAHLLSGPHQLPKP